VQRVADLPRPLLLAFDVDGTLAPIVDDPAAARVSRPTLQALRLLARQRAIHVALVTGRDAKSLAAVVPVRGFYRAVEHGGVVIAPGERATRGRLKPSERAKLDAFAQWVREHAVPEGARLELKPRARVVHVRALARRAPQRATQLLRAARREARKVGLVAREGRAVVEAELTPGDKGTALRKLCRRARARGVVYVGDDLTDVPAIAVARELGGLGFFVSSHERSRPRGATAVLGGPGVVDAFVRGLSRALAGTHPAG
jgi:trehalose 6-phosphate phosphatase